MDNAIKVILKKLDDIEDRIKTLEAGEKTIIEKPDLPKIERDPLFSKAVEIMDKYDELSAPDLAKELKIDVKRAENIMDQMEASGLGTCYTKEV